MINTLKQCSTNQYRYKLALGDMEIDHKMLEAELKVMEDDFLTLEMTSYFNGLFSCPSKLAF